MIDNLSILLSHALLAIAMWRLLNRPDLDVEEPPEREQEPQGFAARRALPNRKQQQRPPDA